MTTHQHNNEPTEPEKKKAATVEKKAALEAIRNEFKGTARALSNEV